MAAKLLSPRDAEFRRGVVAMQRSSSTYTQQRGEVYTHAGVDGGGLLCRGGVLGPG